MLINVNFQKLKKPKIENKNRINDTNKKSLKNFAIVFNAICK